MNTYIVLLRGINVGGHKKVPMPELREILSKSGFENSKYNVSWFEKKLIIKATSRNYKTIVKLLSLSIEN